MTDPRPRPPDSVRPANELTATLWLIAVVLAVLLLSHWGVGEVFDGS